MSHFTKAILDIIAETNGAAELTYEDMITRINQKFEQRGIEQRVGLYRSEEQARYRFLQ
jgi:hypothetical protein